MDKTSLVGWAVHSTTNLLRRLSVIINVRRMKLRTFFLLLVVSFTTFNIFKCNFYVTYTAGCEVYGLPTSHIFRVDSPAHSSITELSTWSKLSHRNFEMKSILLNNTKALTERFAYEGPNQQASSGSTVQLEPASDRSKSHTVLKSQNHIPCADISPSKNAPRILFWKQWALSVADLENTKNQQSDLPRRLDGPRWEGGTDRIARQ